MSHSRRVTPRLPFAAPPSTLNSFHRRPRRDPETSVHSAARLPSLVSKERGDVQTVHDLSDSSIEDPGSTNHEPNADPNGGDLEKHFAQKQEDIARHRRTLAQERARLQAKMRIRRLRQDEKRTTDEINETLQVMQNVIAAQERLVARNIAHDNRAEEQQRRKEEERQRLERIRSERDWARREALDRTFRHRKALADATREEHARNKAWLVSSKEAWQRSQSATIARRRSHHSEAQQRQRELLEQHMEQIRQDISRRYGERVSAQCDPQLIKGEDALSLQQTEDEIRERLEQLSHRRKDAIINLTNLVRGGLVRASFSNERIRQEHERMILQQQQTRTLRYDREVRSYRTQLEDRRVQHANPGVRR